MPRTLSESEISDFRNKLCRTAEQLFIEFGVDGFTMRRLAAALGVSAMTPYRYFKNKSDLLTSVRTLAFQRLATALQNVTESQQADKISPTDQLCLSYIDFALGNTDQYQLMFSTDADALPVAEALQDNYQLCLNTIAQALRAELAPLPEGFPIEKMAFTYWSMLHGSVVVSRILANCDTSTLEEQVLLASHSFIRGYHLEHKTDETATQGRSTRKVHSLEKS